MRRYRCPECGTERELSAVEEISKKAVRCVGLPSSGMPPGKSSVMDVGHWPVEMRVIGLDEMGKRRAG